MWNTVVSKGRLSAFALFLSLSGCTALSDCKYEVGQKIRTKQAWHEFDGCHDQCFTCDYSSGWKVGFYDVVTGGEGCPPVIAPKKYWKPPVFVEHDPSRRDDWYCGFQDGAAYAKCQPDHHYLQAYLPPRTCCPVQAASHPEVFEEPTDFPLEHIHGDQTPENPATDALPPINGPANDQVAPVPSGTPEVQQPSEEPTPAPAPAAAEDYEKDPDPANTKHAPSGNATLRQRLVKQYQEQQQQQATAARESMLRQLVLNATQASVDNGF
ncbi:MAG: hypothetical protein WKF77_10105 [Planctomycetaceae bacterium]